MPHFTSAVVCTNSSSRTATTELAAQTRICSSSRSPMFIMTMPRRAGAEVRIKNGKGHGAADAKGRQE
eukprot:767264-Hanusia_phi.AAC.1